MTDFPESPVRRWIELDVDIDRIHDLPPEDNARRGDEAAIRESVDEWGFYGVLQLQHPSGLIIVGNHRFRAARDRGKTTFNVEWNDLDDHRAMRMAITDNREGDLSYFDLPVLTLQLASFDDDDWHGTGFTRDDLDAMLADLPDPRTAQLPADSPDVRFLLGTVEFYVDPETVADWKTDLENEAGPTSRAQEDIIRGRLGLPPAE